MIRTTFNKLREVKDSLPKGSSAVIAEELGITAELPFGRLSFTSLSLLNVVRIIVTYSINS